MNDFAKDSDLEQEHSGPAPAPPGGQGDPNFHVVDYAQSGSTLLPMLISGIVLIIAGMIAVMIFF